MMLDHNAITEESATIFPQKFEKLFVQGAVEVLTLTIEDFEVFLQNKYAEEKINHSLNAQMQEFLNYVHFEMFPAAIKQLEDSLKNDFPFHAYDAYVKYEIPYNQNCVLSTYYDQYTFTGGAHGSTLRFATTYDLRNGRILPLTFFMKNEKMLLKEILAQADKINEEQPGFLFENYRELIFKTFDPSHFFLTSEGLVLYFGQYDIAPYVSGIVTFIIPFDKLDNAPSC